MTEPLTLYKLIILYMLNKVNFPLTNSQLSNFILEKEYTTYFTLQQAISELTDSDLIQFETIRNTSQYYITKTGVDTLEFFSDKIPVTIQEDINNYLKENKIELHNEVAVIADYYKNTNKEYTVECLVKEGNIELIGLNLSVPDQAQAIKICNQWKKKCEAIYAHVMKELM